MKESHKVRLLHHITPELLRVSFLAWKKQTVAS
jgi:hypothetical protein